MNNIQNIVKDINTELSQGLTLEQAIAKIADRENEKPSTIDQRLRRKNYKLNVRRRLVKERSIKNYTPGVAA